MKKRIYNCLLAFLLCFIMCAGTSVKAFAANIPYRNCYTTGRGTHTFYINTNNFSGYENTSIGHFTVETQGYPSNANITVTIYYGNNAVGFAWPGANGKLDRIGFDEHVYYPAGQYRIVISVEGTTSSGWTGIWLYH